MANHPSAAKRNRQRVKRTLRNDKATSALRTAVKKARVAAEAGAADVAELAKAAEAALARAASKGIIHGNAAARKTARLASKVAKAKKS